MGIHTIQGCTELYMGTHTNIGVYRSIHGYTYKYRGVLDYTVPLKSKLTVP